VVVLDASALLAFLLDEPGADVVEHAILGGAAISTVNMAEVLTRQADGAVDAGGDLGFNLGFTIPDTLTVEPFTIEDATMSARLRAGTKRQGLSLGDRACLALGRRLGLPVLTADRAWRELPDSVIADGDLVMIR
jgi:PIN domain nuclease of toxin-antitoxin system